MDITENIDGDLLCYFLEVIVHLCVTKVTGPLNKLEGGVPNGLMICKVITLLSVLIQ